MKKYFIALLFFTTVSLLTAEPTLDFTKVAKAAVPAVVSVKVELKRSQSSAYDPFGDDFFNRFFRRPSEQESASVGLGSGFIVSQDGYILTNNHIVENASKVTVTLTGGREFEAKVIGADPNSDVAVIKIESEKLPYLKLGDSTKLEVGQWVSAIGNPLGLHATVTVGVVSAIDRTNLGLTQIEDFIQTDAAINRGNSGGPLLNLQEEVIGMCTAIASNTGGYMGIGFAIPSNLIAQIMDPLITTGSFTRGYLGIVLQPVDQGLADAFGLKEIQGAVVADVAKDSPAEKAGLQRGDIILKLNNQPVESSASVRNAVSVMKPDQSIQLEIKRGNETKVVTVKVGAFPGATAAATDKTSLGIQVVALTLEIAKTLGITEEKGVVVSAVTPNSAASYVGIKKGALILQVNQKDVTTPNEFYAQVEATGANKPVLLLVKQGSATQYVSLKIN